MLVIALVKIAVEDRHITAANYRGVFFPTFRVTVIRQSRQTSPPMIHIVASLFYNAAVISVIAIL